MSEDVIVKTINFIDVNMENRSSLGIVWYGGDPLLSIGIIEKISNHILNKRYKYSTSMVTNGYFLDRNTAKRLKQMNIDSVQITLDGSEKSHDKRRYLINKEGTFRQIVENISNVHDILRISIRVNVDETNILEIHNLLDELDYYKLKNCVSLYLAPVTDLNNNCKSPICFTSEEFASKQLDFYKRHINRGYSFINIPSCNPNICGAVSLSSFIIDPLGDLYRCWDDIGNADEACGSIHETSLNNPNLIKWLNYDYLDNKKCRDCSILPLCVGGCPNYIIKNFEPNCNPFKYNMEEFIVLLKNLKNHLQV